MRFGQIFNRLGNSKNESALPPNGNIAYDILNGSSISPLSNTQSNDDRSTSTNELADRPVRVPVQRINVEVNEDIENLDRLRNRAVIDGVSEVVPEYMMNAIEAYVDIKIAAENTISNYDQQIAELRSTIEERIDKIQLLKQPSTEYINNFIFSGIQIAVFMLVCFGGFFIIYHTVATSAYFRDSGSWVCFIISLGIGSVGICNFFVKSSFLNSDKVESVTLKILMELIEQLGMSLVASVLMMIIALQSQSTGLSVTLGLFTFFLSILGGKLLTGVVTIMHQQFLNYRSYRQLGRNKKEDIKFLETENEVTTSKIGSLLANKGKAEDQYIRNRADLEKLKAQKDFYKKFYMHYFQLARSYKTHLTPEQATAIQSTVFK